MAKEMTLKRFLPRTGQKITATVKVTHRKRGANITCRGQLMACMCGRLDVKKTLTPGEIANVIGQAIDEYVDELPTHN